MTIRNVLTMNVNQQSYTVPIVDTHWPFLPPNAEPLVHILASGPSIADMDMTQIAQEPTIFVNGSIQLCSDFTFLKPTAYVISDARFIEHNLSLMKENYRGQCDLYITHAVLIAICRLAPDYFLLIQPHIKLIYDTNKPINVQKRVALLNKLLKKKKLTENSYINISQTNPEIGVSTDIRYGFVEAGTVAYIATQLAHSMGFKEIFIHGMDLINASQPRFYESQTNQAPSKLDKAVENRIIPSFNFLAATYRQNGTQVYNGSPVSKELFTDLTSNNCYLTD